MYLNGHTQHPIQHVHSTQALRNQIQAHANSSPSGSISSFFVQISLHLHVLRHRHQHWWQLREELARLAGQVLVSALAAPVGQHTEETAEGKGKNARLTALLGLSKMCIVD